MPSLPEPVQSGSGSESSKRESTESADESPPAKRPRTEHVVPNTLLEFRRGITKASY